MKTLVLAALFMGIQVDLAVSQRVARASSDDRSTGASIDIDGKLHFALSASGLGSVQTGVTVPGELAGLLDDWPYGQDVLVAGRNATSGLLEHWQWNTQLLTYVKQSSYSLAPADFGSVVYDDVANKIYLIDVNLKIVWTNSWNGTAALPTTGWTAWASSQEVPDLLTPKYLELGVIQGEGSTPTKITIVDRYTKNVLQVPGVTVYHNGTALVVEDFSLLDNQPPEVLLDSTTLNEGSTSITINGAESTVFEVLRLPSGAVIAAGTIPFGMTSTTVTASQAIVIGESYVAQKFGSDIDFENATTATRRYGFGETYADGTLIKSIATPLTFPIGDTSDIYCPLEKPSAQVGDLSIIGNVAFAARNPDTQTDPIMPYGSNQLLIATDFLPIAGFIDDSLGASVAPGYGRTRVTLPSDTSLIGTVLFFQFWFVDGIDIRLSEIIGIRVEDPAVPPMGGASATQSSGGSATSASQAEGLKSLDSSLKKTSGLKTDAEALKNVLRKR